MWGFIKQFKGLFRIAAAVCRFCRRLHQCWDRKFSLIPQQASNHPLQNPQTAVASVFEPLDMSIYFLSPALRRAHVEWAMGVRCPPVPGIQGHIPGNPDGRAADGGPDPNAALHQHCQARLHHRVSQQRFDPRFCITVPAPLDLWQVPIVIDNSVKAQKIRPGLVLKILTSIVIVITSIWLINWVIDNSVKAQKIRLV